MLAPTTVQWEGLTFYGRSGLGGYTFRDLSGWEGWSASSFLLPRPNAHGSFDDTPYVPERSVTVTGLCGTPQERDAVLADIGARFVPGGLRELAIDHAGRALTASAHLVRFRHVAVAWSAGFFAWEAQWRCPDPLRYGTLAATSTTFPQRQGGLRFPLYSDGAAVATNGRFYGDLGSAGTLSLTNEGTADSWPQFEVAGPVDASGFEIVGSGSRLVYEGAVPAGSALVMDTASGTVVMDGDSDRTLSWAQFAPVPAGGSAEWSFVPLGSRTDAVLTATVRPAFW